MSYDKDIDYQAKINEAVKTGDYKSAAKYEKSRNEKIDKENLDYEKTNKYSGWLNDTDYSNIIRNKISSGASKRSVSETLKKRVEKASGTEGLTHYAYDDVYDEAIKYIMNGNSFSYNYSAPEYRDSYSDKLEKAYKALVNAGSFEYDIDEDELYKYYKEEYNREGKRAMQDLMGELSMNTGGIASSYAMSAAGQMLDMYNEKLTDKIPELYAAAFERYLESLAGKRDNLKLIADMSDSQYNRYLDEIEQYNRDRELEYRAFEDAFEKEYKLREFEEYILEKLKADKEENEYDRAQDKIESEQDEKRREIELALEKWKELGYLDRESAEILGLPEGTHTSDYDYRQAQQYKLYNR